MRALTQLPPWFTVILSELLFSLFKYECAQTHTHTHTKTINTHWHRQPCRHVVSLSPSLPLRLLYQLMSHSSGSSKLGQSAHSTHTHSLYNRATQTHLHAHRVHSQTDKHTRTQKQLGSSRHSSLRTLKLPGVDRLLLFFFHTSQKLRALNISHLRLPRNRLIQFFTWENLLYMLPERRQVIDGVGGRQLSIRKWT